MNYKLLAAISVPIAIAIAVLIIILAKRKKPKSMIDPNTTNTNDKHVSKRGIELITSFEGLRTTAYQCSAGVWTIGYGHTGGVQKGDTCSKQQAVDWLKADIDRFERAVNKHHLSLNQNQFDALVSLTYNIGSGAFDKSTLLKRLKANASDAEIRQAFLMWRNANGKELQGLVRRRNAEADLYFA